MSIRHIKPVPVLTLLLGCLLMTSTVYAQKVQVDSAEPSEGEQSTTLVVTINGNGFGNSAAVRFLLSNTEYLGDVSVDDVQVVSRKKLVATISISEVFDPQDYDIEVENLTTGRRGKGHTMFKVLKKGGDDTTTVVYTVALTAGVFQFDAEDVSLNSKGNLNSVDTASLLIERPDSSPNGPNPTVEQIAWDAVIDNCARSLVGNPPIDNMLVAFDDWGVGKNGDDGNLWISLANIRLPNHLVPEKEIQIQLQLRDEPGTRFLPVNEGGQEIFPLTYYIVWGKPLSGKKRAWTTCYESGDDTGVVFPNAELIITRPESPSG